MGLPLQSSVWRILHIKGESIFFILSHKKPVERRNKCYRDFQIEDSRIIALRERCKKSLPKGNFFGNHERVGSNGFLMNGGKRLSAARSFCGMCSGGK